MIKATRASNIRTRQANNVEEQSTYEAVHCQAVRFLLSSLRRFDVRQSGLHGAHLTTSDAVGQLSGIARDDELYPLRVDLLRSNALDGNWCRRLLVHALGTRQ